MQTYVQPRYKMGIGQINSSTCQACDKQRQVHPRYTDQAQVVDSELPCKYDPEDHKRWHVCVIAWVDGLWTSELLYLRTSQANQL